MKNINRNIKVVAVNNGTDSGFSIYIDFSGHREFLMTHRHNGLLYQYLKDGICLSDIKYMKPSKWIMGRNLSRRRAVIASGRLENMVRHLNCVIDDYLADRAAA